MNKTRLVWGIICLVLAAFLGALVFALPPENMMFMLGSRNVPWVPPIVLAIVGLVLLATAGRVEPPAVEAQPPAIAQDPEKAALNKRLETVGWGLFLIMLGGFSLVPDETIPKGVWSIGVGLIMLGLNLARYFYQIRMSGFTTVLGIIALLGGLLQLFGVASVEGAMLLIILGAYLLLKPWFDKHRLFGKAEDSR